MLKLTDQQVRHIADRANRDITRQKLITKMTKDRSKMQTIKVVIELDIPEGVDKEEIDDFVDVTFGECNSMAVDNPCAKHYINYGATWHWK